MPSVATRQRRPARSRPGQRRCYDEHGGRRRKGGFQTQDRGARLVGPQARPRWRRSASGDVARAPAPGDADAHPARRRVPRAALGRAEHAPDAAGPAAIRDRHVRGHPHRPARPAGESARGGSVSRTAPPGRIHKTLRQVLHYAVRVKLLDENPATVVPNPEPKRREVLTFESVAELEACRRRAPPALLARSPSSPA